MLLEIQISVENWNYKVMKHIYSKDCPSHCSLSRTSVVTEELLSEKFGCPQHPTFLHYFALHLSLIILNQTGGQKQLRGKRVKATNEEERKKKRC